MKEIFKRLTENGSPLKIVLGLLATGILGVLGWAWSQEHRLSRQEFVLQHVSRPVDLERRFNAIETRLRDLEKEQRK